MAPAELKPVLETLADKGLVFARPKDGEMAYSLLPLVPGIFKLQFMKASYDPKSKALARLFNDYYFEGWGKASFGFKTSFTRTIPDRKAIAPNQGIKPYRNVKELIENFKIPGAHQLLLQARARTAGQLLRQAQGSVHDHRAVHRARHRPGLRPQGGQAGDAGQAPARGRGRARAHHRQHPGQDQVHLQLLRVLLRVRFPPSTSSICPAWSPTADTSSR